jgi:hypothetical protein
MDEHEKFIAEALFQRVSEVFDGQPFWMCMNVLFELLQKQ